MTFQEYYDYLAHKYPIEDLRYLLILLFVFYLVLIAFRLNGVKKKDDCPRCNGELRRSQKTIFDRILMVLILGILPLRRYKCKTCQWSGLRWNTEKSVFRRTKNVTKGRRRSDTNRTE
jgi:uncharacterized protein with PIN domain